MKLIYIRVLFELGIHVVARVLLREGSAPDSERAALC